MRHLEWEDLGVKVDDRLLHQLRSADDIVGITPNIEQAERMLAEFDSAGEKIGLRLKLTKTMFMKNGHAYLSREVNMMNDLSPELCRRKRAAWIAFKNIEGVVQKTNSIRHRADFWKLLPYLL
uniref:Reverse transcriptase domain-containing protein n=1 Tax=Haemonchus contortus TaxID=6289 RepID=A0A7I5ECD0_HAECO